MEQAFITLVATFSIFSPFAYQGIRVIKNPELAHQQQSDEKNNHH